MSDEKKKAKPDPKKPAEAEDGVSWVDVAIPAATVLIPGAEALGVLGEDGLGIDLGIDELGDALDDALGFGDDT